MASAASRFLKFTLIHGMPFGFLLSAVMLTSRLLFFVWKENSAEVSHTVELVPTYILIAIGVGILRGILLWVFRREDYGY